MKSVLAAAVLLMTFAAIGPAQANDASVFVGKYTAVYGSCKDFPRVYISMGPSLPGPKGVMALHIQSYGRDARSEEILLGAGKRRVPGTDPRIHGEVTEEWATEIRGTSLVYKSRVTRPSIGLDSQTRTILAMQENVMTIAKEGKEGRVICNLVRN
ncbi:MAG TPA: hypothetical protein PL182_12540 [Pseudobdellovibrionaceae bacterium]|nr:hypothetical protein [Pseudobdellovibrionaceae bacterium]